MVIQITDHVNHCVTNADGDIIRNLILGELLNENIVTVSFKNVLGVSSSFMNSAFIALLDDVSFEVIKKHLKIVHSTKTINDMMKKGFNYEVNERKNLIKV
ncbi:STAS-like domain-containing protein [Paenibacillus larvae]|uniref:DUF4325 domain-containing protein n=3 Tax=Paenibacillus larvae TaxID=1464 RepID=A0A1V0UV36_9BACL|nr:STAS-like domain-containing protein [Paenibacillus larvae]AQR79316.1 hypothetical protein BXP28_20945 [Paenibacillus larvae subsp. larvae]ARF69044.1 hypothetical protein B7C51_16370 [Paenibacillus larvae subsp. pulvifaciens]AVF23516.1 hypothetical protein ERICI_03775 [Paenibacillus larvae subsp. larvae]ETK29892.1 hypothetical protein ERIC1_1c34510 [Paenibacillus larvae subsp. larvae DSM 25719]MCY7478772.1 STAS-like domain-containing protein [Paenibacillus larvae]